MNVQTAKDTMWCRVIPPCMNLIAENKEHGGINLTSWENRRNRQDETSVFDTTVVDLTVSLTSIIDTGFPKPLGRYCYPYWIPHLETLSFVTIALVVRLLRIFFHIFNKIIDDVIDHLVSILNCFFSCIPIICQHYRLRYLLCPNEAEVSPPWQ